MFCRTWPSLPPLDGAHSPSWAPSRSSSPGACSFISTDESIIYEHHSTAKWSACAAPQRAWSLSSPVASTRSATSGATPAPSTLTRSPSNASCVSTDDSDIFEYQSRRSDSHRTIREPSPYPVPNRRPGRVRTLELPLHVTFSGETIMNSVLPNRRPSRARTMELAGLPLPHVSFSPTATTEVEEAFLSADVGSPRGTSLKSEATFGEFGFSRATTDESLVSALAWCFSRHTTADSCAHSASPTSTKASWRWCDLEDSDTEGPLPSAGAFGLSAKPPAESKGPCSTRRAPKALARVGQPAAQPARRETADVPQTTRVFQCLPNAFSRDMLVELLVDNGFRGHFDFVYMPCNFSTGHNFGYAFVNFVSEAKAAACKSLFDGFGRFGIPHNEACVVAVAEVHGRQANIARYRNSPVMHPKVPEAFKPLLFAPDGRQLPFPRPTKLPKAPKSSRMKEVLIAA